MSKFSFVPKHLPCNDESVQRFQEFLNRLQRLMVLTGAGISTESGIPDYRSEGVGLYSTSTRRPVLYQDYLKSYETRQRYWARNFVGWPKFKSFLPNLNHYCISDWEKKGKVYCTVTQNVDRLHHKANSKNILELHGSTYEVMCITCSYITARELFQEELELLNGYFSFETDCVRPDGDVELADDKVSEFKVPSCPHCGGILKPNLVFFGDNVPKPRVQKIQEELAACDSLLVLGSSITVFSALRIVLSAFEKNLPIAIVNIGETRGDKYAKLKLSVKCGDILPKIAI